jgi:outer membrane lipoprotein-sorting protein
MRAVLPFATLLAMLVAVALVIGVCPSPPGAMAATEAQLANELPVIKQENPLPLPDVNLLQQKSGSDRLDTVLHNWYQAMTKIESLSCEFQRTDYDGAYQKTTKREGTFRYLKPNQVMIEMREQGDAKFFSKIVYNGRALYLYDPNQKTIWSIDPNYGEKRIWFIPTIRFLFELAKDREGPLLFGGDAREMRRNYEMELLKEDNWYNFILIKPKSKRALSQIIRARLAVRKDTSLPRQLWIEELNGGQTTWDILRLDTAAKLAADDFIVRPPPGWSMQPDNAAKK